jgi:hypothetical protein
MNELRRLRESTDAYGGAMRVQRDRLSLADWLRADHFHHVERFIGRLEQALKLYEASDESSGLREEIVGLQTQIKSFTEKYRIMKSLDEPTTRLIESRDSVAN